MAGSGSCFPPLRPNRRQALQQHQLARRTGATALAEMPCAAAKDVAKPTARTAQTVAVGVVTGVVKAAVGAAVAAGVASGVRNASASITRANPRVRKAPTAAISTHLLLYLQRRRRVQSGRHAAPNAGNAAAANGAPSAIGGLRKLAKPKGLVGPKPNAPITRLPTPQAPW